MNSNEKRSTIKTIDWSITLIPFFTMILLAIIFMVFPDVSANILEAFRSFLGNQMGSYYIILGLVALVASLYIAFSKYGNIQLGKTDKPKYSSFTWGTMIFTSTMAADILYWSMIEWAHYASEPHIVNLGVQDWASTYPLLHWGPIPWSFYIVLAAAFGFMMHVRERNKQKFSEACRPILGDRHTDGVAGKLIDLTAVFSLLAGTATTFTMATPLLSAVISRVFGVPTGIGLTISILLLIALIYTIAVVSGMKAISKLANWCTYLFFGLLAYVLIGGGEAVYIIETGITAIGNLAQNFIGLSTWLDPLRASGDGVSGFAQDWTVFYWAYWMAWCVATPFFIGVISEGRTLRNTILGAYKWGILGTFTSFIVFGNFGLAQQMKYGLDVSGAIASGTEASQAILSIFDRLPATNFGLMLLFITMIAFYSTTFDALTMVVSYYSYKKLEVGDEPDKKVRVFWALVFIIFPIALLFSENSLNNIQTVSIIAAFPVGIIILLIIASFFKDVKIYISEQEAKEEIVIKSVAKDLDTKI